MNRRYKYSNLEYVAMVQLYARADYDSHAAQRLYAGPQHLESLRLRGILNLQVPQARTIVAATQRLLDHGQFKTPAHAQGRGRLAVYLPELDEQIIEFFERDPRRSTRMAVARFNVSQYYIWKVLNCEGLMTPLDFYLWLELKRLVYREEHETRNALITAIVDAFNIVRSDRDTLVKMKDNQMKHAQLCFQRNGLHFEQLLRYRWLILELPKSTYANPKLNNKGFYAKYRELSKVDIAQPFGYLPLGISSELRISVKENPLSKFK